MDLRLVNDTEFATFVIADYYLSQVIWIVWIALFREQLCLHILFTTFFASL